VAAFDRSLPPVPAEGEQRLTLISSRKQGAEMKHVATMALIINLGVAGLYGQQRIPVKMEFSGTAGASAIDLQQDNTTNDEENFAGNGTFGQFTFRNIRAIASLPQPSSTCSGPGKFFFNNLAGAGVFRFQDGSLLKVTLIQGSDCVDLVAQHGNCTLTLQITGGSGRFEGASGVLTLTEVVVPVPVDTVHTPVFFASTGVITGMISGVGKGQDGQSER
jgi:hypothetical protein